MRTVRCSGHLRWGVCLGEESAWGGVCLGGCNPPWTDRCLWKHYNEQTVISYGWLKVPILVQYLFSRELWAQDIDGEQRWLQNVMVSMTADPYMANLRNRTRA